MALASSPAASAAAAACAACSTRPAKTQAAMKRMFMSFSRLLWGGRQWVAEPMPWGAPTGGNTQSGKENSPIHELRGTLGGFSRQHYGGGFMKEFACLLLMLGLAITAAAADITGNWSGSFNITGP